MNTRTLVAVLFSLVPVAIHAADIAPKPGPVNTERRGVLWALVLHSETGNGLEGIPVYVSSVTPRDPGKGTVVRALTGQDGMAQVTGLPRGEYVAWVNFNNHVSELASFTIDGSLLAKVAIEFNPDID